MAVQNSSFSVQIKIFTALQLSRILPFFLFILAYNKGGLINLIYKSETRGAGGYPHYVKYTLGCRQFKP